MKERIQSSLQAFAAGDLADNARRLFQTLGYDVSREAPFDEKTFAWFRDSYFHDDTNFNTTKALSDEWRYVDLLFQLSAAEVERNLSLFDTRQVDDTRIESYLFFAIELAGSDYTRTALAGITRELNRVFPMPCFVLFKYGDKLTLAVVNRRLHKRDESRDVLLKVTLIKDIDVANPKRSHIEILHDLALPELQRKHRFTNFVELHEAWQKTLDTKELNKRFFQELANWYFWAVQNVTFPDGVEQNAEVRHATSVIRLITRLIFVWFLREKGLVPNALFRERELNGILKKFRVASLDAKDTENFTPEGVTLNETSSAFYKAILQNLFFATLNSNMGERKFIAASNGGRNAQHFVHNVLRYESEFINPETALNELFAPIPFLNGGLFECLDKEENGQRIRVDGFSDHPKNVLRVPDELFFGAERDVDLSTVYDDKKKAKAKVRGLINILDNYKFTIAENTPLEEEIALDPELLGKVFENLLANYNPETKTTARKQTGSFYTPREIVNYMVDESLIAYLKAKLQTETFGFQAINTRQPDFFGNEGRKQLAFEEPLGNRWQGQDEALETALRELFAYTATGHDFNETETEILIKAIDECKILDPACGSGAFPMGVLHRLVFLLGKLDHRNAKWREWQEQKARREAGDAFKITDQSERDVRLKQISEIFEFNSKEYGRKLFLIENCIYGVDIQPIAIQIAKLRFFISLIIDQKIDDTRPNRGVLPLPNLETNLIAANTLLAIDKIQTLKPEKVGELERELKQVRSKIFRARTLTTKKKWRNKDKEIRTEIATLLKQTGFAPDAADKIANWQPDNQDTRANWFDAEWMFGIEKGFDIVIGNPPYLRVQGLQETQPELVPYYRANYKSAQGSFDLYAIFIERGFNLLNAKGEFAYIVPHKFFQSSFGKYLREIIVRHQALRHVVRFGSEQVFDNPTTYTCLLFLSRKKQSKFDMAEVTDLSETEQTMTALATAQPHKSFLRAKLLLPKNGSWDFVVGGKAEVLKKLRRHETTLGDITRKIFQGLATSADKIYVLRVLAETPKNIRCYSKSLESEVEIERGLVKPFLMGKDVHRYEKPKPKNVVIFPYSINGKAELMSQDFIKQHFPLCWQYLLANKPELEEREHGRFRDEWHAFSRPQNLTEFEAVKIVTPEIALGCQMSLDELGGLYHTTKVYSFVFNSKLKDDVKYLLGVLNSKVLWFFLQSTGYVLRGGYFTFKTDYLKPFPIPCSLSKRPPSREQETTIAALVDYVLFLKQLDVKEQVNEYVPNSHLAEQFEEVIDALVYELYFAEEFQGANIGFIKYAVRDFPPIEDLSREKKIETIHTAYQKLRQKDNEIRNNLKLMDIRLEDLIMPIKTAR